MRHARDVPHALPMPCTRSEDVAAGVPTVVFGALLGLVVREAAEEVPRLWTRPHVD